MFHSETDRYDSEGKCLPIGPLNLRDAFFNPLQYYISGGTDPLLRGLLRSSSRELDEFVSIVLTTQLFILPQWCISWTGLIFSKYSTCS